MYNDREDREEEKSVCVGENRQIVRVEAFDRESREERDHGVHQHPARAVALGVFLNKKALAEVAKRKEKDQKIADHSHSSLSIGMKQCHCSTGSPESQEIGEKSNAMWKKSMRSPIKQKNPRRISP